MLPVNMCSGLLFQTVGSKLWNFNLTLKVWFPSEWQSTLRAEVWTFPFLALWTQHRVLWNCHQGAVAASHISPLQSIWALCASLQGAQIFTLKTCQESDKVLVGVKEMWAKQENHPGNNLL